jgi:hypothetical protein
MSVRRAALILMLMAAITIAFGIFAACYNAAPYEPLTCNPTDTATFKSDSVFRIRVCASQPKRK